MGSLGPFEIIIIAVILLLFFGAKRLPELARGIGKSLKEFKKATRDIQDEIENPADTKQNHSAQSRKQRKREEPEEAGYPGPEESEESDKKE